MYILYSLSDCDLTADIMKFYFAIFLLLIISANCKKSTEIIIEGGYLETESNFINIIRGSLIIDNSKSEIIILNGYLETESDFINIIRGSLYTADNGKKYTEIIIEGGYLETENAFLTIIRGSLTTSD